MAAADVMVVFVGEAAPVLRCGVGGRTIRVVAWPGSWEGNGAVRCGCSGMGGRDRCDRMQEPEQQQNEGRRLPRIRSRSGFSRARRSAGGVVVSSRARTDPGEDCWLLRRRTLSRPHTAAPEPWKWICFVCTHKLNWASIGQFQPIETPNNAAAGKHSTTRYSRRGPIQHTASTLDAFDSKQRLASSFSFLIRPPLLTTQCNSMPMRRAPADSFLDRSINTPPRHRRRPKGPQQLVVG